MRRINRRTQAVLWTALLALVLIAIYIIGATIPEEAYASSYLRAKLPPSWAHPFGTDSLGRDLLMRTLKGLSISMTVGLAASAISAVIAVLVGIAATHWCSLARLIRGEVLQLRSQTYIAVSRKLGKRSGWILVHHLLPHLVPQFFVGLILTFPHAVLHEASISFLGFGLPPEQPAIGIILSESMQYLSTGLWWSAVFPGLLLVAIVLLVDRLGDQLRRILDPASAQE